MEAQTTKGVSSLSTGTSREEKKGTVGVRGWVGMRTIAAAMFSGEDMTWHCHITYYIGSVPVLDLNDSQTKFMELKMQTESLET